MGSRPHEGLVVPGHGHGEDAHGYCAGFDCCDGVLAVLLWGWVQRGEGKDSQWVEGEGIYLSLP